MANWRPAGDCTWILPDGSRESFGPGGAEEVTVGLHDKRVAMDIARDPKVAFGEAYMDGRLTIEQGDIVQLLNWRWAIIAGRMAAAGASAGQESGGEVDAHAAGQRLVRRNPPDKAKQNVAHHYDLSDELYELFLDLDRQYSCAYFTDPANGLEQAQADKKAHIAAKLYLKPGQRVLDIGCGWGGTALYLNRVADVDVLGVTLSEEQLRVAGAAPRSGRRRPGQVRANRLSRADGHIRQDRVGRHVRACRRGAL